MKEIVLNEVSVINQTVMPTRPTHLLSTLPTVEASPDPIEALADLELVLEPEEYLDLLASRQRSKEKR